MIKHTYKLILTSLLLLFSCAKEEAIPAVADFTIQVINDDYTVPVHVAITNKSEGADNYQWTFQGGTPNSSTSKHPGTITYNQQGIYTIKLEVDNQDDNHDSKEITLEIKDAINIGFNTEIIDNNYPPTEVVLTNNTTGAETYHWTFEGGIPQTSNEQNPTNVVFNEPGEHLITLEVSNGLETYQETYTITVAPHLEAAFEYQIAPNDDDLQVPVTLTMINNSISATDYQWTFIGANQENSSDENPTITFSNPGTYTLKLEATNGKETTTVSQEITLLPNTNLRVINDVQLGINTAHTNNNIGAFYSTINRETYTKDQVTNDNGANIDIAFFGLNQNFTFNKFVSPDEVQNLTFNAIPNATHTKFINLLENCNCTASLTVDEFNNMTDDSILNALTIEETNEGLQDFDNTLTPRIILFETQDGRKGAIKIKDFVVNGLDSYIVVDIKVMKE